MQRPEMRVWSRDTQPWIRYADHLETVVADRDESIRIIGDDYTELADGIEEREDKLAKTEKQLGYLQESVAEWSTAAAGHVDEIGRLHRVMAAALERTQVDDCGEATMILEAEVKLDGSPADKDNDHADPE